MTHPSRHRRRGRLRSWYVWHRWIGVSAALLVVVLAITGIALNHTEQLRLDERAVTSDTVLAWYGIEAPHALAAFAVGSHWLSQADKRWYFDDTPLPGEFGSLRGAATLPSSLIAAASTDAVWLLTERGEVVERMDAGAGVPGDIRRLGVDAQQRLVLDAGAGYARSDTQYLQWRQVSAPEDVRWAEPSAPPEPLRQAILQRHRGAGLSLERVLLDLHSGRLFGRFGVYVMDVAAILMLVLAASGTWLWLRGLLRKRRH